MNARLRSQIRQRAGHRCEYCHFPEDVAELRFQADHVLAGKHGGQTGLGNLAGPVFAAIRTKGRTSRDWTNARGR